MSNALAIATVTTALAQIVRSAAQSIVSGANVVTERPDTPDTSAHQIHLFLYQVLPNTALRNADLPTRSAEGNLIQRPTIALDLYYLLTFYGNDNELEPQRMLGAVVPALHAQPGFTRQMIADAITSQPFLTNSDLAVAVEQVKLTLLPLTLEELSKLWSIFFQTPYALSVAYQGTVVLIESEERAQPALPVLRRGEEDRGVDTLLGPFPVLESIHIGTSQDAGVQPQQPSFPRAQLGAVLTIRGRNLGGNSVRVRFTHHPLRQPEPPARPLPPQDIPIAQANRTATEITVQIPDNPAALNDWAAGLYTVTLLIDGATESSTNMLSLSLAPQIKSITPASPIARHASGNVTLTITCAPKVLPQQRAVLLLADREFPAQPHATAIDTLQFVLADAPVVTDALVYLRVDGVDSMPFKREGTPPQLVFDDDQKVTIRR